MAWDQERIAAVCRDINFSLRILTAGNTKLPVEAEILRFRKTFPNAHILSGMGLVQLVRPAPRGSRASRYRVNRASITEAELRRFINQPPKER